jgi:ketosteroid isomerase-like protein
VTTSNVDVVRRGYDAMQRRDLDELLGYCDPEVTFVSLVGQVEGTVYQGREGILRFFSDLLEVWEVWIPQPQSYEEAGDAVLVTGTSFVRGTGSGLEMTVEWGQVFRLRDGKVLWSRIYLDPAEAREEFQSTST